MGVLDTARTALAGLDRSGGGEERSRGAYWCHDCGERVRDADVDGHGAPRCPDCGDGMVFERSPDPGACAC